MAKSIKEIQKRRRGRPATGRDPAVTARLPQETIDSIDEWARRNDEPTRAQAIRRLVEIGLKKGK
jgi:hypothetical protein